MKLLLEIAKVLWRLALTGVLVIVGLRIWQLPDAVDRAVKYEAEMTRRAALAAIAQEGNRLDARLAFIEQDANRHLDSLQANLFTQSRDLARNADYRLEELTRSVDRNLTALREDGTEELRRTSTELNAMLAQGQELLAHSTGTVADLHPQLLGLIAASKVTAGQTAQSIRTIDDAVPEIVDSIKTITQSGAKVAPNVASNLEQTTDNARKITDRMAAPGKWIWRGVTTLGKVVRKIFMPF